jgi:hypothetical protein
MPSWNTGSGKWLCAASGGAQIANAIVATMRHSGCRGDYDSLVSNIGPFSPRVSFRQRSGAREANMRGVDANPDRQCHAKSPRKRTGRG